MISPRICWILALFVQEVICLDTLTMSVCYGNTNENFRSIICPTSQVILVRDIRAMTKPISADCPVTETAFDEAADHCCSYDPEDCGGSYSGSAFTAYYDRCHGKQQCLQLQASWENTAEKFQHCNTSTYMERTNYMSFDYSCVNRTNIIDPCSSTTVTDSPVYLWNSGYPDASTSSSSTCTCSVEVSCQSNIQVTLLDLRFEDATSGCLQRITLSDTQQSQNVTCADKNGFQLVDIFTSSAYFMTLSFWSDATSTGGHFWMEISGLDNAEFTLSCGGNAQTTISEVTKAVCLDGSVSANNTGGSNTGSDSGNSTVDSGDGTNTDNSGNGTTDDSSGGTNTSDSGDGTDSGDSGNTTDTGGSPDGTNSGNGTNTDNSSNGTNTDDSGNGTNTDDSGNGTNTDNSGNGTNTDGSDSGTNTDNSGNGTNTDGSDSGTNTDNSGNGTNTDGSDSGTNTGDSGNGTNTDGSDSGTNTGDSGNGTNTDGSDSGTNTGDSGNGTNTGDSGNGTDTGDSGNGNGTNTGDSGNGNGTNTGDSGNGNGTNTGDSGNGTDTGDSGNGNGTNTDDSGNGTDTGDSGNGNGTNTDDSGNGTDTGDPGNGNGTNTGDSGGNGTNTDGSNTGTNTGNSGNGTNTGGSGNGTNTDGSSTGTNTDGLDNGKDTGVSSDGTNTNSAADDISPAKTTEAENGSILPIIAAVSAVGILLLVGGLIAFLKRKKIKERLCPDKKQQQVHPDEDALYDTMPNPLLTPGLYPVIIGQAAGNTRFPGKGKALVHDSNVVHPKPKPLIENAAFVSPAGQPASHLPPIILNVNSVLRDTILKKQMQHKLPTISGDLLGGGFGSANIGQTFMEQSELKKQKRKRKKKHVLEKLKEPHD